MNAQRLQNPIEYPAVMPYKVIGEDEHAMRTAVAEIAGPRAHQIDLSNTSTSGRYVSLTVQVRVEDEVTRVSILERLQASDAVKFVL